MRYLLYLFLFFGVFAATGISACNKLKHKEGLLTLQALGESQTEIREYIEKQRAAFQRLKEDITQGKIYKGFSQNFFYEVYGEPIFRKQIEIEGIRYTKLLYRDPVDYYGSDRIYLYFNANEFLTHWEYLPK